MPSTTVRKARYSHPTGNGLFFRPVVPVGVAEEIGRLGLVLRRLLGCQLEEHVLQRGTVKTQVPQRQPRRGNGRIGSLAQIQRRAGGQRHRHAARLVRGGNGQRIVLPCRIGQLHSRQRRAHSRLVGAHRQAQRVRAGHQAGQVLGRVGRHQAPAGNDQDPVADRRHLGQNVAGEDHGVLLSQRVDQVTDLDDLQWVKADGWLIQDNHLRVAQQRLGNAHALAIALGQVLDQPVLHRGNLGAVHHSLDPTAQRRAAQALGLAHKAQVFQRRHVQIDRRLLRQIADAAFGLVGLVKDVIPVDGHSAGRGRQAAGDNVHGCAFSRAVGAEKAVNLSLFDGDAQVVDGDMVAVLFAQMLNFNQEQVPPRMRIAAMVSHRYRQSVNHRTFPPAWLQISPRAAASRWISSSVVSALRLTRMALSTSSLATPMAVSTWLRCPLAQADPAET